MGDTLINNCLLCLKYNKNLIHIFDEKGNKPLISKILLQHFWFETDKNTYSNYICSICWEIVEKFHKLYEETLEIHNSLHTKISEGGLHSENLDILALNDVEVKSENFIFNDDKVKLEDQETFIQSLEDITANSAKNDKSTDDETLDGNLIIPNSTECDSEKNTKTGRKRKSKLLHVKKIRKEKNAADMAKIENEDDEIRKYYSMECELCSSKFNKFQDAKTHYRVIHKLNGYLSCCGKKFRKRCYALDHLHWHLNPDEFTCKICNKTYADKRGLDIHQHTHLPANMKPFKCPKCPQTFAKMFLLRQHEVKHVTDDEKSFICDECGKAFAKKCILQFHKRGAHEGAFTHVCEICAKSFKSKLFYQNHMKNVHSSSNKPPVQCTLCNASLKHEYSLRKHMARHEDLKKTYICEICNKQAPNQAALKSHHNYVHASERSHKCNVCNKAFKKAVALKEHLTTHTGEILYSCPHCPKTFNSSANLHSHRKKAHTKEWEENRRNKMSTIKL